jgi:glycosyltransferase involved in cell wall biosynthesis
VRIALVSDKWVSSSRNGVSVATSMHAKLIEDMGHDLIAIGKSDHIKNEKLLTKKKFYINANGSGAVYSPIKINKSLISNLLIEHQVQLLIIEGWQTAITDSAIEVGHNLSIPVALISHGISLHPFSKSISDTVRSIFWLPYKIFRFPKLLRMISAITALDLDVSSTRFYDRDQALLTNKLVYKLVNCQDFPSDNPKKREDRTSQIIVVGYFSYIKNQLEALKILKELDSSITMKFIGKKNGLYYKKCLKYTVDNNLTKRVSFLDDKECSIQEEIRGSMVALSTSITEVQPIFLLEAMASGTPFVSSNVGSIPKMKGGMCGDTTELKIRLIRNFFDDLETWNHYSTLGVEQVNDEYNQRNVRLSLMNLIENFKKGNP